jgi:SulP family sulfate permease
VWAILVPEGVAYAQLAGVPPVAALSAAPGALLAYALLGTSRQAIVGGTTALAIMSAATVAPLAAGNAARYASLTAELALLAGLLAVFCGVVRLGFVASFLSRPVLTGFIFGLSLVVVVGQVHKLLGIAGAQGNFFAQADSALTHLDRANAWTVAVGAGSLALLFGMRRFVPRAPAALAAAAVSSTAAAALNLAHHGVSLVGTIPAGLPGFAVPELSQSNIGSLLPGALGIVLVGYAEHLGAIRRGAMEHHYDVEPDQELIALGMSNVLAGLCKGFSVGGSLSKTTVNDSAGAQTQASSLVIAALVVVTGLLLTPLFRDLPVAALGAIVIVAVWGLLDVPEMRRLLRLSREAFALALAALLGELVFDVLPGLLVAVGLSFALLIYRASRPHFAVLGKFPGEHTYADLTLHPDNETVPGLILGRLDAQLFFANAGLLRHSVRSLAHASVPRPQAILLDMEATMQLDVTSADILGEIAAELRQEGVVFLLARVRDPVLSMLRRSDVAAAIGEKHIYHSMDEGVQDFLTWRTQVP